VNNLLQSIQEKGWWAELILLLLFVAALNFALKKLLGELKGRFHKHKHLWQESAVSALLLPLTSAIWASAGLYGIQQLWDKLLGGSTLPYLPSIYRMIWIAACAWFLMRWKKAAFQKMRAESRETGRTDELGKMDVINKAATVLIFAIAALLLLEQTGSSMNSLIALGGIGGLALAFASQQIISNFFGGVMIYFTQPFQVGDSVLLPEKNISGDVEEIGWYTTQILTPDKRPLYIPNSLLANALVINPSRTPHREFKTNLTLRYQDLPQMRNITQEIKKLLIENKHMEKTIAPQVHFTAFGANGLNLSATAYTIEMSRSEFADLTQELLYEIAGILEKNGAEMAPQYPF
jgi:MscS family membrane protein